MKMPGSFFLVGPMGAGKSTIGRQLARALKLKFYDSDREIERRTGADISLIFELEGESGFRKREKQVLEELSGQPGIVLATGGGAILDADSRQHLKTRGWVIYLYASVDQQLERTSHDRSRPLLQTDDPKARLQTLMEVRDPLYRDIADLTIDTDGCKAREVVQTLVKHIEEI